MSVPSPSLDQAGLVPQILKFNGYGEFAGLLYHWPHNIPVQERAVPEVLQVFEAPKFLDHKSDLGDHIRECERVEDVASISAVLAEFTRRDWGNVALVTTGLEGRGSVLQVPPASAICTRYSTCTRPGLSTLSGVAPTDPSREMLRVQA